MAIVKTWPDGQTDGWIGLYRAKHESMSRAETQLLAADVVS